MKPPRQAVVAAVVAALAASTADAKIVVCVDGAPDLSGYEGFVSTQINVPPDTVIVGSTITNCMSKCVKGDTLIIIAHGYTDPGPPKKIGFIWQGGRFPGFGSGPGQYPVPAGFGNLNNMTVTMGSCWSARDPDGAGGQAPVTTSLANAMKPNAGNTVTGFNGSAYNNTITDVGNPETNSAHQIQAAKDSLGAHQSYWRNYPPAGNKRKPPTATDEQKRAKRLVDSLFVGKNIPVTIRYTPIRDSQQDPFAPHLVSAEMAMAVDDTGSCPSSDVIFVTSGRVPIASPVGLVVIAVLLGGVAHRVQRERSRRSARPTS